MTTQAEAIAAAGRCLAEGIILRDSLPVEEAARLAYTPTGPSIAELEERIRAQRTQSPHSSPSPRRVTGGAPKVAVGPQPGAESGTVSGFESQPAPGARGKRASA